MCLRDRTEQPDHPRRRRARHDKRHDADRVFLERRRRRGVDHDHGRRLGKRKRRDQVQCGIERGRAAGWHRDDCRPGGDDQPVGVRSRQHPVRARARAPVRVRVRVRARARAPSPSPSPSPGPAPSPTPPPCTYAITPTTYAASAGGGAGPTVSVSAANGCTWTAASNDSWITVTSGASGKGNGSVAFSVASNPSNARSGSLTIAGQTFSVQQAPCTYGITPTTYAASPGGGAGPTVSVSAVNGCTWTATSNDSWITITSRSDWQWQWLGHVLRGVQPFQRQEWIAHDRGAHVVRAAGRLYLCGYSHCLRGEPGRRSGADRHRFCG